MCTSHGEDLLPQGQFRYFRQSSFAIYDTRYQMDGQTMVMIFTRIQEWCCLCRNTIVETCMPENEGRAIDGRSIL